MKIEALLDVIEATLDVPVSNEQKILLLRQLIINIRQNDKLLGK